MISGTPETPKGSRSLNDLLPQSEMITTVARVSDGEISRFKAYGAASGDDLACDGSAPASREV